jgi:hypothetical protein
MKKQTAVEWLVEQLECFGNKHELQLSWATVDELVQQAKAMEREQIATAYQSDRTPCSDEDAEQYYNENYGGDK